MSRRLRLASFSLSLLIALSSAAALYVDGHFSAPLGTSTEPLETSLVELFDCVSSRGTVSRACLGTHAAALAKATASLAALSPLDAPERFPTPVDRLAYWLNARAALTFDALSRGKDPTALSTRWLETWPVGGKRLTLGALERRFLEGTTDPRVPLSVFTGARSGGVPAREPFFSAALDHQLNEATQRFVRRPENASLDGKVVRLSPAFHDEEADILAALPRDRRSLLQFVWAFLPDTCEGLAPGCLTRSELDQACGAHLEKCSVAEAERTSGLLLIE